VLEVFGVFGRQESAQVVVEPPGDLRRGGIFEVDDGILVAGEFRLVKERARAVKKSGILKVDVRADAFAIEAREQRGRAGAVKALIVIEDPNSHPMTSQK
jgi:hypothetical protein